MTIQKGVKQSEYYKNVCLVLDDDETNQLCTDTRNGGFNGLSNTDDYIIWNQISFEIDLFAIDLFFRHQFENSSKPKVNVSVVKLIFRKDPDIELKSAAVADLKIFYQELL